MELHVSILEAEWRESFALADVVVGLAVSVPSSAFRDFSVCFLWAGC